GGARRARPDQAQGGRQLTLFPGGLAVALLLHPGAAAAPRPGLSGDDLIQLLVTVAGVLVVSGILLAANLGEKSYDWTGVSYALYLALCGGVFALYSLAAGGYLIQAADAPSRQDG